MLALSAAACSSDTDDAAESTPAPAATMVQTTVAATEPAPEPPAETAAADTSAREAPPTEPPATEPEVTDLPTTTAAPTTTHPPTTLAPTTAPPTTVAPGVDGALLPAPEDDEEFYVAPDPLPGDGPGDVIWARRLDHVPTGARGWLILYRSEDVAGEPIAVSGVVMAPEAAENVVVTWAHGTTGLADQCAPSKQFTGDGGGDLILETAIVERGWTFVATDYEGLGTDGVHPYLVGQSEGRGVLDIVRAAQRLQGSGVTADAPVAIFGHSQGGHGALMAGDIAGTYAPELDVIGAVGVAPAGELSLIEAATSAGGGGVGGFGLMILAGFLDAYPHLSIDAVANDEWKPLIERVADTCIGGAFELAGSATGPRPNGNDDPEWKRLLDENSPASVAPSAPVLITHGDADNVVPPVISELIFGKYCALGVPAQRTIYPGADHGGVMRDGFSDMMQWIEDRLTGLPAPSSC